MLKSWCLKMGTCVLYTVCPPEKLLNGGFDFQSVVSQNGGNVVIIKAPIYWTLTMSQGLSGVVTMDIKQVEHVEASLLQRWGKCLSGRRGTWFNAKHLQGGWELQPDSAFQLRCRAVSFPHTPGSWKLLEVVVTKQSVLLGPPQVATWSSQN